jgi:hypothetical protein
MRLDEYLAREKLVGARIAPPETNKDEDSWAFHYRVSSTPSHLVTVIVHCDGGSEVSRLVEP